jgi:hypothetical protein
MRYTVTDVTTSHLLVRFENGSQAHVKIEAGWDVARIEEEISKFIVVDIPKVEFVNVDDVPLKVGHSNDLESYMAVQTRKSEAERIARDEYIRKVDADRKELAKNALDEKRNRLVKYGERRELEYPSIGDQLDALYHARHGDSTMLLAVDKRIKEVKEKYPKDTPDVKAVDVYSSLRDDFVEVIIDGEVIQVAAHLLG